MARMNKGDNARNAMSRIGAMGVPSPDSMRQDTGKQPMTTAHYRPAQDPATCCGTCQFFDGVDSCSVVAGKIDPNYVSDLYQPAQQQQPPQASASAPPTAAPAGPVGP